jgi:hypothetical protein
MAFAKRVRKVSTASKNLAPAFWVHEFMYHCLIYRLHLTSQLISGNYHQCLIAMGFIDNKYVAKFISGGAAPPFPPSHEPGAPLVASSQPSSSQRRDPEPQLPPGWFQQWESDTQRVYYLEQATGRTQWVPPATVSLDSASMLSGKTTVVSPRSNDVVRRNHLYLNLPTATEREEIRRKEREKRERQGPPKYVFDL